MKSKGGGQGLCRNAVDDIKNFDNDDPGHKGCNFFTARVFLVGITNYMTPLVNFKHARAFCKQLWRMSEESYTLALWTDTVFLITELTELAIIRLGTDPGGHRGQMTSPSGWVLHKHCCHLIMILIIIEALLHDDCTLTTSGVTKGGPCRPTQMFPSFWKMKVRLCNHISLFNNLLILIWNLTNLAAAIFLSIFYKPYDFQITTTMFHISTVDFTQHAEWSHN